MNVRSLNTWFGLLTVLVLLISALGCAQTESRKLVPPTFYADEVIDQVNGYVDQGYKLLKDELVDSAVATFAKVEELIPNGLISNYHTACAYGRTGQTDQAFASLNKLVDAGFDNYENLNYDTDLESLQKDSRWEALVAKTKANAENGTASFGGGLPHYESAPQTFATIEECDAWVQSQTARIRKNGVAWTQAQLTAARIDLAAQKLVCMQSLKADDAGFDINLERVREAAKLSSPYSAWGARADLVMTEVENSLSNNPSPAARNEILYQAGMAMAMKYNAEDQNRVAAYAAANKHLGQVEEGTEFYPAAQTLMVVNDLRLPNADKNVLGEKFKGIAAEYSDDKNAYRIIATQYGAEAVSAIWPIPIDLIDIDGKEVKLADYHGKVLLIDFWATWCGPCRAELPNVLKTYEEYHDQGFEIVSISLDYKDRKPLKDYREWIADNGMTWRHTYDGEGWNTGLVKKYFVSGIPATFLVGPDGSLIAKGDELRGEKLAEQVKKALGAV